MEAVGAIVGGALLATAWILLSPARCGQRGYPKARQRVLRLADGSRFKVLQYLADEAHPAAMHALIIPGNPGIVEFYERFAWNVHAGTGGRADVTVVSHLGHSHPPLHGGRVFDFRDQTDHKERLVAALAAGSVVDDSTGAALPRPRALALLGHSIGAWMAVEVMRRLPGAPVAQAHLLTPTLHRIGETPNGVRLTPVFRHLRGPLAALVGAAGLLLPRWALEAVLRWQVGEEPCCREGGWQAARGAVVRNALTMALHEMEEVGDMDEATLRARARDLRAVFAWRDGWVPRDHEAMLLARVPALRATSGREVAHAFVLGARGAAQVGRTCAAWLCEELD